MLDDEHVTAETPISSYKHRLERLNKQRLESAASFTDMNNDELQSSASNILVKGLENKL